VDFAGLTTIVGLRRRYMPDRINGVDVLDGALDPASGLIAPPPTTS
jgi:hypothetical protein